MTRVRGPQRIVCLTEEPTEVLLHEIKSPIILQPGPAALFDGVDALHAHIAAWAARVARRVAD